MAFGRQDRNTGIETKICRTGDERIVVEALVQRRVGHHHDAILKNRVRAERHVSAHVDLANARARAEEDVIAADHVDRRNRHIEHPRRDIDHRTKAWKRATGPHPISLQSFQPFRLARQNRRTFHKGLVALATRAEEPRTKELSKAHYAKL
jgi:hypothetical protein